MGNAVKQLLEFGPFRVDPEQRLLLRDQQPIPLSPKAFDLLLVLAQRSGQVVLKDDLMKLLWPNTFVEESNLGQHVFQLRKALGERPQDHAYIVTIPGRGYRFAPQVRALPAITEEIVVQSHSRSRMVVEEETLPARPLPQTETRRRIHPATLVTTACLVLAAAIALRPEVPAPRVTHIRQLTNSGHLVYNTKLVTDGPRIYFREWQGRERLLKYVSPEGGEVVTVPNPLPNMDIDDISANGSQFLILDLGDAHESPARPHSLWQVAAAAGSPQPVGDLQALDARWSPDGSLLAYSHISGIGLANPNGSNPRKLASVEGNPIYPQWSRDGQGVRFSLPDPKGRGLAMWQADLSGKVRQVLPNWPVATRPHVGEWTPDGHYFFFTALGDGSRDIWAMRETGDLLRRVNREPVRMTNGPITFYGLAPAKDGRSLFAIGVQARVQLQRYDSPSRQFVPYAGGMSVDHVAFSRDGQWMAYVEVPQGVLVRSRVDGTERRQLTFPPMRALHPQWSPDGSQLAFQGKKDLEALNKIYVISKDGGLPVAATPPRSDQQLYPSWSSTGDSIVFSGSDEGGANSSLYRLDLKSKQISEFPGTADLYWGQISPDGRHIVALTDTTQKLILYDTTSHATQTLAPLADYPFWSADGNTIYFSTLFFRVPDSGIYRYEVASGRIVEMLHAPEFLLGGSWGVWFGLTPAGDPLVARDMSSTDLYSLDLDLP